LARSATDRASRPPRALNEAGGPATTRPATPSLTKDRESDRMRAEKAIKDDGPGELESGISIPFSGVFFDNPVVGHTRNAKQVCSVVVARIHPRTWTFNGYRKSLNHSCWGRYSERSSVVRRAFSRNDGIMNRFDVVSLLVVSSSEGTAGAGPDRRGQAPKGTGGMPRRHQMAGVEGRERSGGAAQRASIPEYPLPTCAVSRSAVGSCSAGRTYLPWAAGRRAWCRMGFPLACTHACPDPALWPACFGSGRTSRSVGWARRSFFYGNLDNLVKGRNKKRKFSAKGNKF
jgi:hypothetical protein